MIVQAAPGETREQFIRRVVATANPLSPTERQRVRQMLPPVRRSPQAVSKAA
ncbi:hypothetical protein [Amycolatopsis keratiniphila]|uniref:hypothetical protein n=1 Tax=Amycolatopsis keratiniphila TaxID=129921 RepID=UPI000A824EE3|nr:hypothetical protein [Amycolatopsis keratiniphila]